ncbi:MAG: hypothetical protein U5K56_13690 [Halioglobus sp.]|nr:hypothetical protein [Halioglobus sp.]
MAKFARAGEEIQQHRRTRARQGGDEHGPLRSMFFQLCGKQPVLQAGDIHLSIGCRETDSVEEFVNGTVLAFEFHGRLVPAAGSCGQHVTCTGRTRRHYG